MTDANVENVLLAVFQGAVDQMRAKHPLESEAWCIAQVLRVFHFGGHDGDMTTAPPLPGSGRLDDMFGTSATAIEVMLDREVPGRSKFWLREMTERILLGDATFEGVVNSATE